MKHLPFIYTEKKRNDFLAKPVILAVSLKFQ